MSRQSKLKVSRIEASFEPKSVCWWWTITFSFAMGLACALNAEPDMCVVAEADNGEQAIKLFREHRPDLVILDWALARLERRGKL